MRLLGLQPALCMSLADFLELCALRCTREGDDVADVLHTGYEEDEALEAETESAVGA